MKINIINNRKQVDFAFDRASDKALYTIGMMAESHAKQNLTDNGSVDTGLLRNSVTFARDGQKANAESYTANKGGKSGSYSGTAPTAGRNEKVVYIGTNVEYAPHVELGTVHSQAKPYLRPAAENHANEYKEVLKKELGNAE